MQTGSTLRMLLNFICSIVVILHKGTVSIFDMLTTVPTTMLIHETLIINTSSFKPSVGNYSCPSFCLITTRPANVLMLNGNTQIGQIQPTQTKIQYRCPIMIVLTKYQHQFHNVVQKLCFAVTTNVKLHILLLSVALTLCFFLPQA